MYTRILSVYPHINPRESASTKKKSFTLIELLITTAIISMVGLAVYSVFANAIALSRRTGYLGKQERKLRLTLERFTKDIRNTFEFSPVTFDGRENYIIFPALIDISSDDVSQSKTGSIMYFFDDNKGILYRDKKVYPELFPEKLESAGETAEPLADGIKKFKFSYCYLDNATGDYEWKDNWKKEDQDTYPQAVKLEIGINKGGFSLPSEFNKVIFIPIGTGEQKKVIGGK